MDPTALKTRALTSLTGAISSFSSDAHHATALSLFVSGIAIISGGAVTCCPPYFQHSPHRIAQTSSAGHSFRMTRYA
ncbi:hypothetical protein PENSPDRAFT_136146 [Peniophora sp. CONT]|nr:hypothetical protein PENSPDRAFT_136146 [Peniophora sp. CONT]